MDAAALLLTRCHAPRVELADRLPYRTGSARVECLNTPRAPRPPQFSPGATELRREPQAPPLGAFPKNARRQLESFSSSVAARSHGSS